MNRRIIFILSLIAVSSQSAAAVEQLFTVPFENCYKDFGTGNNTWYICPDIASSVKTNKVFPTDNLFLQSLPVKSEVSVSFTCKTSQPVTAEISIMDSSFLLQTSAVDDWKKFEKVLSYSDAGTSEWTFLVKLRGSEFNSVKSDCSIKVLQNLSHVATTTLAAYVKVRTGLGRDIAAIIEPLSTISSGTLSETRIALDGAIKNIDTVLSKPVDPLQKLLLTQSKASLESMKGKLSVACTDTESLQCTSELNATRGKANALMTSNSDELDSLRNYVEGEIGRVKELDQTYMATLSAILTEIGGSEP